MSLKNIATGFVYRLLERKYEKGFRDQHKDLSNLFDQSLELLDYEWYGQKYLNSKDVSKTKVILHYLFVGVDRDLNPNSLINFEFYNKIKTSRRLRSYSDYAIFDFLLRPNDLFIDPSPDFNGTKYLSIHSDVRLAGVNPLVHYFLSGQKEKRSVSKSPIVNLEVDSFIQNPSNVIQQSSCLLIFIDSVEDLNELKELGDFEKVLIIANDEVSSITHQLLNAKNPILIAGQDQKKNIELVYHEIKDCDVACKLNLRKRIVSSSDESLETMIGKIDRTSIFCNQQQNEKVFAYDGLRRIGILGPWSFYYGALEFIKADIELYQQYCNHNEQEENWNFFASGSYYFRPVLLKTVIERLEWFDDFEFKIYNTTFKINAIDLLIAKANHENGFDQAIIGSTDVNFSKNIVKYIDNISQFRYRIKSPFQNIWAELTIVDDLDKIKNSSLFDKKLYQEDNPTSFEMDPKFHYLRYGVFIGLNPSLEFDTELYTTEYLEQFSYINPLVHYVENGESNTIFPTRGNVEFSIQVIKASGLFDEDHYLQHVEFKEVQPKDPLRHYCEFGWKKDMSPSPEFDEFGYTQNHLTRNKRQYNPLLHYILKSKNNPAAVHIQPKILNHKGVGLSNESVQRICLFAGFDKDGIVDDYVIEYITELDKYADVFYLSASFMEEEELDKLNNITVGRWSIAHNDYDFGSYQRLANHLVGWKKISKYDELMLVNDSSYLVRPMDQVFEKMNAQSCHWWGLEATKGMYKNRERASTEIIKPIPLEEVKQKHLPLFDKQPNYDFFLGSYFLVFRKPIINLERFRNYLNSVSNQSSKELLIIRYEIGLNRMLMKSGFEFKTFIDDLYPFHPLFSMNHFNLIGKGFPLFKRYLLTTNHYKVKGLSEWKELLLKQTPHANISTIENNILRIANYQKYYNNLHVKEGNELLSDEAFCELDEQSIKDENYWVFPVCAYDHGINGNLRAVFESVKDDPSIKKIILTREKHIEYGGENVVSLPLHSREGQEYLLKSMVVFLKHSRFRNVYYSISGHDRKIVNLWHGIPLKRIGTESLDQQHNLEALIEDNAVMTSVIASSKIDAENMHRSFKPLSANQVWTTGLPRNDFLLKDRSALPQDMIDQLDYLDTILSRKRLILFVPTFRNSQETYTFSIEALNRLEKILKTHNAVIGVRDHFASERKYIEQFKHLDAISLSGGKLKDIEMLYRKAAVLLTDYSSCYIDYLLLDKPVISFAYDLKQYTTSERGLYFDLNEVFPGYICKDVNMLLDAIDNTLSATTIDFTQKHQQVKNIFHQFTDGENTARLITKLKEEIQTANG